jgi:Flp pilus assembly pilin Flp
MSFSLHRQNQIGQGLVEYALIIVGIALAVLAAVFLFGEELSSVYCLVAGELGGEACGADVTAYCRDDMSTTSDWDFFGTGRDLWVNEAERLCKTPNNQTGFAFSRCSRTDSMENNEDYAISLKGVELLAGSGYGVMFRLQNYSSNPNGYAFQYDTGLNAFVFRKWVNGWEIWNPLARVAVTDYEWYRVPRDVDIVVRGETMEAYIDGKLVLTAHDNTYTAGGVGLRTWGQTEVCFDDFLVHEVK